MVKANDFLKYLCGELDIKLFTGMVCSGLLPIFNKMDGSFMHYIPTIVEKTAYGIACGSYISGVKSAILIDYTLLNNIDFKFSTDNGIPLCIISYTSNNIEDIVSLNHLDLSDDFISDLDRLNNMVFNDKKTTVLRVKEGILK